MRIAIASDHGGYEMKDFIVHFLADKGINVTDLGTNSLESVDYPVYADKVTESVLEKNADWEKNLM